MAFYYMKCCQNAEQWPANLFLHFICFIPFKSYNFSKYHLFQQSHKKGVDFVFCFKQCVKRAIPVNSVRFSNRKLSVL